MPDSILKTIFDSVQYKATLRMLGRADEIDKLGIMTGFGELDRLLNGMLPGQLIILAGRPGTGKTALMLNIAEFVSLRNNDNCVIFSLEMTKEELAHRLFSSLTNVPSINLKKGLVDNDQIAKMQSVLSRLHCNSLYIHDKSGLNLEAMRERLTSIQEQMPVRAVFIDYLQLMKDKSTTRYMEITNITRGLKCMAKEFKVPIICLSQLSRSVEKRDNKMPVLSDLRDSGSIEEDADCVLLINKRFMTDSNIQLFLAKNRHGKTGVVNLHFNSDICKFRPVI